MRVLGITGGIATGKSTVTGMLAALGAPTVSADVIGHSLFAPGGAVTQAIIAAFPGCANMADAQASIDRRALARIVFNDAAARLRLEAIIHPPIITALKEQIAIWREAEDARAAAAEIPLLFETHLETQVDQIVVVVCAYETQIARVRERGGHYGMAAERIIAAQWPLAEKIARADVVITTDGDLEDTRRQVEALWQSI